MVAGIQGWPSEGQNDRFSEVRKRYSLILNPPSGSLKKTTVFTAVVCGKKEREEINKLKLNSALIFVNSQDFKYLFENIRIDRLIIFPGKSSWDGSWKLDESAVNNLRKFNVMIDFARSQSIETILFTGGSRNPVSLPKGSLQKFDSIVLDDGSFCDFISSTL